MAGVRASVISQAREAASDLGEDIDPDCAAVDRLVRCASLSPDARQTLQWAADTLRAHPSDHTDELACELLTVARARLTTQPTGVTPSRERRRLAWL